MAGRRAAAARDAVGVVDAAACEQALRLLLAGAARRCGGDTAAVRRMVAEARPYLSRGSGLANDFDRLEKSLPRK